MHFYNILLNILIQLFPVINEQKKKIRKFFGIHIKLYQTLSDNAPRDILALYDQFFIKSKSFWHI